MKLDQALHQHSDFGYTQLNVALHFFLMFFSLFEGYFEKESTLHHSFEDTCRKCPPGTYGANPSRTSCSKCKAGVICLEGMWIIFIMM